MHATIFGGPSVSTDAPGASLPFVMWFWLSVESADEARGPKAVHHLVKVMGGRLPIRKHGREDVVWLGARNRWWICH